MKNHVLALIVGTVLFFIGLILFPAVFGKSMATFWNMSSIAIFLVLDAIGVLIITSTKMPWVMLVGALVVFAVPAMVFSGLLNIGLPAASVGGNPIQGTEGQPAASCVSSLQTGTASSLMIGAYDKESATPATAVNLGTSCWVFKHTAPGQAGDALVYAGVTASTSPTALTSVASIGDVIDVICGGTSYYTEPARNICVASATQPINLNSHGIALTAGIKTNCYTNTGATACTAGTNTTLQTWKGTFGANQDDTYYLELQVNTSYVSYNLGGMATYGLNHCDQYEPASGMTAALAPKSLKNVQVGDLGDTVNVTVSYNLFKLPAPVLIHNWGTYKVQMRVSSDSSNPATTGTFSAGSQGFACFLDSQYALDASQQPVLDVYQHDANTEALVGYSENYYYPVGAYACTSLELV